MPLLIFTRRSATEWQLENVGNGPALDLLLGERNFGDKWTNEIISLYPVAAKTLIPLPRLKSAKELAVTYKDAYNRKFTSVCDEDTTKVFFYNKFPKWKATDREWRVQKRDAAPPVESPSGS